MAVVGTAGTGAPLANAAISLECVGGSFATNADARGAFRIEPVPADAAPCLLRAQGSGAAYVAPVANLGGGTVVANATPLTHLLSSRLLGQPADLAFQNAGPATLAMVEPAAISAARGQVRSQLDRLGISVPGLSSDWVTVSFSAQAGDPHDDFLEALNEALREQGQTVATAAAQLASGDASLALPPRPHEPACTPRLSDGFAGAERNRWAPVGDGGRGARGIGIGGGPGFTSGALVEVTFADGTRLTGARTDADHGMVTLVPCHLADALPALVRMTGPGGSTYYDAGSSRWTSFEGRTLHAVVNAFEVDSNLAVTPFTEAVYRRVLNLGSGAADSWHDAGRIERAHDEIKATVNDLLPGMYRVERLDRMPFLIDHRIHVEHTQSLPRTPEGIHGLAVGALSRAAIDARPDDVAPALAMAERFAADMADGVLDDPYAGLDPFQIATTAPSYTLATFWPSMAKASLAIGRETGLAAFWSGKPFPLALVRPSGHRDGISWPEQYIGLYSDGILRSVIQVDKDLSQDACGAWCLPVRKVPASAGREWWVYEFGQWTEFDPESRIGRMADGSLWYVGNLGHGQLSSPFSPVNDYQPAPIPGLRNARAPFEVGTDGKAYRLTYPDEGQGAQSDVPPERRDELPLPARVRQLSSDGRLVYALLSNGEVYVLNPEIIASEVGFFPIEGMPDELARRQYWGTFRSAGYPRDVPLRIDAAERICGIGGTYLQACSGQLLVIDRVYHWVLLDISWGNMRAPGADYIVRPASGLDARGWRAFKAPLSVDLAWDDSVLRLLSRTDGSYVLESDTWGVRDQGSQAGQLPRRHRVTQELVNAWLGG